MECKKCGGKMVNFLIVLVIIQLNSIQARQSFDQEPSHIEVNPGQDVTLPCRIFDKSRNSICSWQKNGFPISLQNGKYQFDGDRQRGDCSLKVFQADINFDDGKINFLLIKCEMYHLSKLIVTILCLKIWTFIKLGDPVCQQNSVCISADFHLRLIKWRNLYVSWIFGI